MTAKRVRRDVPSEVRIRFENSDAADPDSRVLGEFMMLLRAVYAAAVEVGDDDEALDVYLATRTASEVTALLNQQHVPLLTRRISHESPLEIILIGVAYKVVQAAWRAIRKNVRARFRVKGPGFEVSGAISPDKIAASGSVNVPGIGEAAGVFEIDLPTGVSEATQEMRGVLSQGSGAPITYGAGERTVKLTKTQVDFLAKQDATKAGNGGFQKRLSDWQKRLHKTTRELTLSSDDIDFIMRNGSKGNAGGGWQGTVRKIFDTHFNFPPPPRRPPRRRPVGKP